VGQAGRAELVARESDASAPWTTVAKLLVSLRRLVSDLHVTCNLKSLGKTCLRFRRVGTAGRGERDRRLEVRSGSELQSPYESVTSRQGFRPYARYTSRFSVRGFGRSARRPKKKAAAVSLLTAAADARFGVLSALLN